MLKRMLINLKYVLIIGISFVILSVAFFSHHTFVAKNYPYDEEKIVTIPKGINFNRIVDILYEQNVIRNRFFFRTAGKLLRWEDKIQSGMFVVPAGKTHYELLKNFRYGRFRKVFEVTIPEGLSNQRIAGILSRNLGVDSVKIIDLCSDSSFVAGLGIHNGSLKGYLFPARYRFFGDDSEEHILRKIVNSFWVFFNDTLKQRAEEMGKSIHEIIIMASIVEGETFIDSEKPRVAGLYYNRLQRNMRLQADATVQYALRDDAPRRLLYRDYEITSPYNTYLIRGLPPGPINNPGRQSIIAALYPENHNYLYMVTDGSGGHRFSETYSEHQRAVRQFRQWRFEQESGQGSGQSTQGSEQK